MPDKKTPLLIGAGLVVAAASLFGAVSATASPTDAPDVSTPATTGTHGDHSEPGWTTERDGVRTSGAPGVPQREDAPAGLAH